ncbi:hypothetical protein [Sulfurimonas sp.]|uniref:hypothetical protein n=1 Tax=Sulfurimonas sp. TaxID=2022749 RepID=UPI0026050865|nr:hypothetical protein [Sulfurimonas sp.]MCW8895539.1 plasmid recombination protein [Sulfurimonas sp.]MCW9067983.1 plasmid recombination protein [Sulfurimonas sp.]
MTAVLRIEKRNFADTKTKNGLVRGVDNNSLAATKKHNERLEINHRYEMKSKQRTNINEENSYKNVYFKRMSFEQIKKIKEKPHRSNSVGAFELVFDFQDLTEDEINSFDVLQHKALIDEFLEEQPLEKKFELLSYVYHGDEKNPHFHLVFSGWNQEEQSFNFNDEFNPKKKGEPFLTSDGNPVFLKHNRGKQKSKYLLDEHGNKQIKYEMIRENGVQKLQDKWGTYLKDNNFRYSHKKKFTSLLQFPNYIWHSFDSNAQNKVLLIRELEKERIKSITENNHPLADEIEIMLKNEVLEVLNIAQHIQDEQVAKRAKNKQKTLINNKLI